MDPSVFALLGSVVLVIVAVCILLAVLYIPYTLAHKVIRALIRTTRSTVQLILSPIGK